MNEAKLFLDNLLNKNDIIVVGISGGPDSMCLLDVLNSYKKVFNLKIICAHVNHNVRKESIKEAQFVKKYCEDNNIIFEYMIIDSYHNDKFSEQEGRKKRYQFFNELMNKYHAKYLMTAHHGDDLIETIMMRIVRGSNLKGYIGIPKISTNNNYSLVRPLLYVTKDEIFDYLEKNDIGYVIDKSNDDIKYTRNRYRKQLLPFLKNEDLNVHKKFLLYSEELEDYYKYVDKIVLDKYIKIANDDSLNIDELLKEDKFIIKKVIEKMIEIIQKDNTFNIDKIQLDNIIRLISNSNNKEIYLSNGFIARKSYNKLYIEKKYNTNDYKYILDDKLIINNEYLFEIVKTLKLKNNYVIRLDSSEIKLPIIIRSKKDGDRIIVKNLNGTKKINDIFIDSKIDMKKRKIYPIVTDSNDTILWVPGLKKSKFDKEINEKYDIIIKCTEGKYE